MKLFKKLLSLTAALAVAAAVIPFSGLSASAAESILVITPNEEKTVIADKDNSGSVMYFFTPPEDGIYAFYSYNGIPAKGKIVDLSQNMFVNSPERRYNGDFYIQYEMKAEQQYLLSAEPCYQNDNGQYCLKVTKLTAAQNFYLENDSIVGFVGDTIEINATFDPEWSIIENIEWTSSDESIVNVTTKYAETPDVSGAFTFKKAGTAAVTAVTESGFTDRVNVKVAEPSEITLGEEKTLSSTDEFSGAGMYSFVPEESGFYAFYSYNNVNNYGIHGAIYDSEMNLVCEDWQSRNNNFYVYEQLTAGETYYLKCGINGYCGDSFSYSVKLDIAASAERIELSVDSAEVYIGTSTNVNLSYYPLNAMPEYVEWSIDDNSVANIQWFSETQCQINFVSEGTVTLSATTKNGLSDTITFTVLEPDEIVLGEENTVNITSLYGRRLFKFIPEETAVYSFSTETDIAEFEISDQYESYYNRFQGSFSYRLDAGETYYLYAGFIGDIIGEYTFTVTRPTQVTSIEILSLPDKLDYYEFDLRFDYRGLKLKITYENGKVYYWSDSGDDIGGYELHIYPIYDYDNYQYTEISCGAAKAQFTFNIMENPVSSIVITKAPEREYFYGDVCFGYLSEDGYYLYPDITGIEFTVNYTDGTSVQYGDDAFDKGDLNDKYLNVYVRNNKTVVGKNTVVFSYMNVETTYEVTVKEDTVESISMTKAPDNTKCFEYFAPDLTGAEFTITYNDGTQETTETVTVTSKNQGYDNDLYDVVTLIPVNGSYIIVSLAYDKGNNPYYTAEYLSQSCRLDCFTFAESKEIEFIGVDSFNTDFENTAVNVTYTDFSTESFPLNVVEAYGGDEFKQIFCRSDKGVFCVMLDIQYDQKGYKEGYWLKVFGFEVFVSDPFGDINGDGVSDIRDLVRLKKILAKVTQDGEDKADLDGDGSIDAIDAAEFRKYLLVKPNVSDAADVPDTPDEPSESGEPSPSEDSSASEKPTSGI